MEANPKKQILTELGDSTLQKKSGEGRKIFLGTNLSISKLLFLNQYVVLTRHN